jgi:hypothetical protein
MKRRGFLKAVGLGAAAAPIISQGAFAGSGDMLAKTSAGNIIGGYGMDKALNPVSEGDWRADQIKSLKAIINGGISEDEKSEIKRRRLYQKETAIRESVACLQSVSQTRKLEMVNDRIELHEERMVIERAKERLHWLLKEMVG